MTAITTESIPQRSTYRPARRSVLSFIAGVALASTVALGVNVATDGSSAAKPTPLVVTHASIDPGCAVMRGPC
jgi:hypothetical protein